MIAADWISDRRALIDAAAEGPWERDTHYGYKVVVAPPEGWRQTVGHVAPPDAGRPPKLRGVIESCNAANGDFIADARTSLPKALDALEAVLERARIEQDDAELGMRYAAEVDNGLHLISEQARKQAWTGVARLIESTLGVES